VLRAEFTDARDTLVLDLTAAYAVEELQSLRRTFVYSREGEGSLEVTDEVAFTSPQAFETSLVTLGRYRQDGTSLIIYSADEAVSVTLEGSAELDITSEVIQEDVRSRSRPTRIAVRFQQPVTRATLTARCVPVGRTAGENGSLLRNGDFSHEGWCWDMPPGGMGTLSTEQAASGEYALKIEDASSDRGSNIHSAAFPIDGDRSYELRGKVFGVSGGGIGLYVQFLDGQRGLLNDTDASGNLLSIGTVDNASQSWEPFAFSFETPPETAYLQVWIHSYNASQVTAYLDDLIILRK
jgi:hypothetical protein